MIRQIKTRDGSVQPKSILGGANGRQGATAAQVQALKDHYINEVQTATPEALCAIVSNVTQSGTVASGARDGVTLATGDIVLCIAQTTTTQNGRWRYSSTGAWSRVGDVLRDGFEVKVLQGADYPDTTWRLVTDTDPHIVGTTAQMWRQVENTAVHAQGVSVGIGTRTPESSATRLAVDGDTATGTPTVHLSNASSVTVLSIDGSASSGGAMTITAGGGTAIEVSGGSGYLAYLHRNSGAPSAPVAYIYNQHASDGTTTAAIENGGTGYAVDVTRTGVGTVPVMRVQNTTAGSNQTALSVANASSGGGNAVRAVLSNATASDPSVYGSSAGTGAGGYFTNSFSGTALQVFKSGTTGLGIEVNIVTSGNADTAIYGTTSGTGRVAQFERGNSGATLPVLYVTQSHASSTAPGISVSQVGTGAAIYATSSGNSVGLQIERNVSAATVAVATILQDHASSNANALVVTSDGGGSAGVFAGASATLGALVATNSGAGPTLDAQGVARIEVIEAGNGTPTMAAGAQIGGGGTAGADGPATDLAGSFTMNVGTAPGTNGIMATMTFSRTLPGVPRAILLTPANATALTEIGHIYVDLATMTTTTFDVKVGAVAHAASVTSIWQYIVIV